MNTEIKYLLEKNISIYPHNYDAKYLVRYFYDKAPNISDKDVYKEVVKLKVGKFGNYSDDIVNMFGELLWLTVCESERNNIKKEYKDITDQIIEILIPATGERPLGQIFNRGIVDCFPQSTNVNNRPNHNDMISGFAPTNW
ncbi:13319_t:CDS:1 [Cetraspora pellucida]|uniref:13319_t:CDS:1 n=1 Tax=Cetraspora pellucida TaxID=1433469 RepID=A0A9N9BG29_9GLOM|nr:13319_t:CDS:1 [Cetraspora pellucida]